MELALLRGKIVLDIESSIAHQLHTFRIVFSKLIRSKLSVRLQESTLGDQKERNNYCRLY
jgi:hypothetical protein